MPVGAHDMLEAAVRAAVRAELRRILTMLVDDEPAFYSSRRGGGPPGYAERTWRALAKRIGVKRGRWYVVTRDALLSYERSLQPAPAAQSTSDWTPRRALEMAGIRPTR